MAAKPRAKAKIDPTRAAAIEFFAARSHAAWRKRLLQTNPEQRGKPRMRLRGGSMVDVNQPWAKLDPKARRENKLAASDAYDAITKFPNDREAASAYVHECWMRRNKADKSQPRALFRPYAKLPEIEKDKDRAHVDAMKRAVRAVGAQRSAASLSAKDWARLEAAARALSRKLGRLVSPRALLKAGIEAALVIAKHIA